MSPIADQFVRFEHTTRGPWTSSCASALGARWAGADRCRRKVEGVVSTSSSKAACLGEKVSQHDPRFLTQIDTLQSK